MKSRPHYSEAVRSTREVKREAKQAGNEIIPAVRPNKFDKDLSNKNSCISENLIRGKLIQGIGV